MKTRSLTFVFTGLLLCCFGCDRDHGPLKASFGDIGRSPAPVSVPSKRSPVTKNPKAIKSTEGRADDLKKPGDNDSQPTESGAKVGASEEKTEGEEKLALDVYKSADLAFVKFIWRVADAVARPMSEEENKASKTGGVSENYKNARRLGIITDEQISKAVKNLKDWVENIGGKVADEADLYSLSADLSSKLEDLIKSFTGFKGTDGKYSVGKCLPAANVLDEVRSILDKCRDAVKRDNNIHLEVIKMWCNVIEKIHVPLLQNGDPVFLRPEAYCKNKTNLDFDHNLKDHEHMTSEHINPAFDSLQKAFDVYAALGAKVIDLTVTLEHIEKAIEYYDFVKTDCPSFFQSLEKFRDELKGVGEKAKE